MSAAVTLSAPAPELNLVRLEFKHHEIVRFLERRCRAAAEDLRYMMHMVLKGLDVEDMLIPFQIQAPKRPKRGEGTVIPILSYGASEKKLRSHLILAPVADAEKMRMVDLTTLAVKPMPFEWVAGDVYRFEVEVMPTMRFRNGERSEIDFFLFEKESNPEATREEAYQKWLTPLLGDAAEILDFQIGRCKISQKFFRAQPEGMDVPRRINRPTLPDTTLCGHLRIQNPTLFAERVCHGIGRYRWLGFGMLQLYPV
jgi:hypothetical protein